MQTNLKTKVQKWIFSTFSFIVPSGVIIYNTLLVKIFSEPTLMGRIGFAGMFFAVIGLIIGLFFYNRHLKNKLEKVRQDIKDWQNKILLNETSENEATLKQQLQALVVKENKIKSTLDIFHNLCFFAPFVILLILITMIENGLIELRGTFFLIVTSMAGGLGYNSVVQILNHKAIKGGN